MADIKDKQYSLLKENLENLGKGAKKHQNNPDPEHPLPSNLTEKRYTETNEKLTTAWTEAQEALKVKNEKFDTLKEVFKKSEGIYNTDVHTIKGIFTIYSETLRDFGIQPEKKRPGRTPKKP